MRHHCKQCFRRFLVLQAVQFALFPCFRFEGITKNFKLYYDGQHYVGEKRFDTVQDLVADGLITFYLESKAADYIAALSSQSNYAESPYVAYNTHKKCCLVPRSKSGGSTGVSRSRNPSSGSGGSLGNRASSTSRRSRVEVLRFKTQRHYRQRPCHNHYPGVVSNCAGTASRGQHRDTGRMRKSRDKHRRTRESTLPLLLLVCACVFSSVTWAYSLSAGGANVCVILCVLADEVNC